MSGLILVRGLPGSGKSTLAKNLIGFYLHLETDMFWGEDYKFDASRLGAAHEWCRRETLERLAAGWGVVVSNTFTTLDEMRPYFKMAAELGIVPQVITCHGQFGSVHNVPAHTIEKMKARFVTDLSELYN